MKFNIYSAQTFGSTLLIFGLQLLIISCNPKDSGIASKPQNIKVENVSIRNKNVQKLNFSNVPNGYYSIKLKDNSKVVLRTENGKVVEYIDNNGYSLLLSQNITKTDLGYFCDGILCTCRSDDGPDCDKMLEDTGCTIIIDSDGITYCIRGLGNIQNSSMPLTPLGTVKSVGSFERRKIKTQFIGDNVGFLIDSISGKGYIYLKEKSNRKEDRTFLKYDQTGALVKKMQFNTTIDKIFESEAKDFGNEVQQRALYKMNCDNIGALDTYSAKCGRTVCQAWNCLVDSNDCNCEGGNSYEGCKNTMCFYCWALDGCPERIVIKDYGLIVKVQSTLSN